LNELEKLKPKVQQKINEFNNSRRAYHHHNGLENCYSNNLMVSPVKKQSLASYDRTKVKCCCNFFHSFVWESALKVVAYQWKSFLTITSILLGECFLAICMLSNRPFKEFSVSMFFCMWPGNRANYRSVCLSWTKGSAVF